VAERFKAPVLKTGVVPSGSPLDPYRIKAFRPIEPAAQSAQSAQPAHSPGTKAGTKARS